MAYKAVKDNIIAIVDSKDELIAIVRSTEKNQTFYSVKKMNQEEIMNLLNDNYDGKPVSA